MVQRDHRKYLSTLALLATQTSCVGIFSHVFPACCGHFSVDTPAELDCTQKELWECDFIIC